MALSNQTISTQHLSTMKIDLEEETLCISINFESSKISAIFDFVDAILDQIVKKFRPFFVNFVKVHVLCTLGG